MLTNIARGSENTAAQRLSPWRKGTRRRDRRATSPESARARARADAASAQAQSEARAKSPQGHPASRGRRALCETTSVTGAFCSNGPALTHAFCNDKARVRVLLHSAAWGEPCRMLPRASAGTFLLRLPIGRRIVLRGATLPALSVVELDKHKTPPRLTKTRRRHANLVSR